MGTSLVACNSRKPKSKAAEWSPGREADPEDPVASLIARTFDYLLIHAINVADGRGITVERYSEISGEFVSFMEKLAKLHCAELVRLTTALAALEL